MNKKEESLQKSKKFIEQFCSINNNDNNEKKLEQYFENKKLYLEIFNADINVSTSFVEKIKKYKPIIYKHLSKNLEYIIFKDGHLKTKRFAILNSIKLVNPMWIDDKISYNIFNDDDKYIIKTNFTELIIYKNLNGEVSNSFTKELDSIYEDDFDFRFNRYIDVKMKSIRSQKNNSNNKNNKELYYPLFDKSLRQKRTHNNTFERIFIKNPYSEKKNINIVLKKNVRSKSNDSLKKQSQISIENNEFKLSNDNVTPINTKNKKVNNMIPNDINIFNNEGKVSFYTYNCTKKEIDSVNNLQFFHYNGEIKDIPKEFNNKKEIVLLNYEENKYNYKTYKFLFDKIIIIDI